VQQADQKPKNAKELFNLRHSSLRNVIKRIFGVLKQQWQILGSKGCEYSINTQINLFCALVGLYNFGKQCREDDLFIDKPIPTIESQDSTNHVDVLGVGNLWMNQKRDDIAACMWNDYQSYIQRSRQTR
jgi:hypothetical protein